MARVETAYLLDSLELDVLIQDNNEHFQARLLPTNPSVAELQTVFRTAIDGDWHSDYFGGKAESGQFYRFPLVNLLSQTETTLLPTVPPGYFLRGTVTGREGILVAAQHDQALREARLAVYVEPDPEGPFVGAAFGVTGTDLNESILEAGMTDALLDGRYFWSLLPPNSLLNRLRLEGDPEEVIAEEARSAEGQRELFGVVAELRRVGFLTEYSFQQLLGASSGIPTK